MNADTLLPSRPGKMILNGRETSAKGWFSIDSRGRFHRCANFVTHRGRLWCFSEVRGSLSVATYMLLIVSDDLDSRDDDYILLNQLSAFSSFMPSPSTISFTSKLGCISFTANYINGPEHGIFTQMGPISQLNYYYRCRSCYCYVAIAVSVYIIIVTLLSLSLRCCRCVAVAALLSLRCCRYYHISCCCCNCVRYCRSVAVAVIIYVAVAVITYVTVTASPRRYCYYY